MSGKVAVALKYDKNNHEAPKVIAKGEKHMANRIIEKAKAHDVAIYKDEHLSNQLLNLSLGEEIPEELYTVVAEVLVFISKFDQE